MTVSIYHLEARLFVGPLAAPLRDEWRVHATDDPRAAERWACEQFTEGFTVWVYDHSHPDPLPLASDLHLIAYATPDEGFDRLASMLARLRTPSGKRSDRPGVAGAG